MWEEMPGIVAGLKETLPAYARLFEFFCLRRKRDPKDDPLFFNTTSFLVITAKDLLDGGLAAANIENMAVAEGAGVLYSGYLMRVIKASARLKEWLGITEEEQIACCMLMGYPAVSYRRTAPEEKADRVEISQAKNGRSGGLDLWKTTKSRPPFLCVYTRINRDYKIY